MLGDGKYTAAEMIKDNESLLSLLNGEHDYSLEGMSMALIKSICVSGTIVASDGMCSGSAYSLYLQDRSNLDSLQNRLGWLCDQINAVITEPGVR